MYAVFYLINIENKGQATVALGCTKEHGFRPQLLSFLK
jgi:hypothetical protein